MKLKSFMAMVAVTILLVSAGSIPAADMPVKPVKPAAANTIKVVDLNASTVEELQTVKGIGPALALKIIEYRQKNGPFKKVDDLLAIQGIGPKSIEDLRPFLKVSAEIQPGPK